jgi:hypothetical protein
MGRPKNRTLKFESRLDWLQFGSFFDEPRRVKFIDLFIGIKEELKARGFEPKETKFPRYQGEEIGPFKFMVRHQDAHHMIIASGASAPDLAHIAQLNDLCGKCLRLDSALTMTFDEPQPDYAEWMVKQIRANDAQKQKKTRTAFEFFDDKHANTGIRNKRCETDIKWNAYDAGFHHQGRMDSREWRWEVKTYNGPARRAWELYTQADDKAKLCAEMTTTRFRKLGIVEPAIATLEPCPISGTRKKSRNEDKLIWMDKTICHVIKMLAEDGFSSDLRDLFHAHGLTDENGVFLAVREKG